MKKSSALAFAVLALATRIASAYDPSPLQDFCVGADEPKYGLFVNGKFCKDPNLVVADDFYTSGLDVMKRGDVFVFPMGMPHFQMNIENTPAVALAAFNGQDPGKVPMPVALFGSFPPIRPEVLARSLWLDRKVIEYLQAQFQIIALVLDHW